MNALRNRLPISLIPLVAVLAAAPVAAQVPVDDSGAPIADFESFEPDASAGNEDIPLLAQNELQELVGPIALYPDDLLAIVLPASTYPLQLVQAQRFLEDLEEDPSLQPDDDWDDSVVALLNYPEVIELLNEDLDWTWRLGEAVVAQQADVLGAVEQFRDRAYAAGNLKSDTHQTVARNDGTIEITPVEDDVIYVPYYEPQRVVVYQSRPVFHYYPRAYPVYYYPYPVGHEFYSGFFWGVTTAFTVGWLTDSVHVIHHSYHGHPYYGRHYWDGWWYRRPTIHVHNHYYSTSRYPVSGHRYSRGDNWRPRYENRRRLHDHRIARSNYYSGRGLRHRSYTATRPRATATSRATERHGRTRSTSADRRPAEHRPAAPAARRAIPQQASRARQGIVTRRQSADTRQPNATRRQPARPERVARRDNVAAQRRGSPRGAEQSRRRVSENREQRRVAPPRRQQPSRSSERPSKERNSSRGSEQTRHASSRSESRRQRH